MRKGTKVRFNLNITEQWLIGGRVDVISIPKGTEGKVVVKKEFTAVPGDYMVSVEVGGDPDVKWWFPPEYLEVIK